MVKLYISLISEFFNLSDVAVMASGSTSNNSLPRYIPATSTSLSAAHYLQKILVELQECTSDVNILDISNDIASSLRNMIDSVKWRFDDILINTWLQGQLTTFPIDVGPNAMCSRCNYILLLGIVDSRHE